MKILHTSDLHLGLSVAGYSLLELQKQALNNIAEHIKSYKPSVFIIAGDVFDRPVPPAEAITLFDDFLTRIIKINPDMHVIIISGNHDSAERLNMFRSLLNKNHVYMIGQPPVNSGDTISHFTLNDKYGGVTFWMLPFVKPQIIKNVTGMSQTGEYYDYETSIKILLNKSDIDYGERNVIISHQFFTPSTGDADSVRRSDFEKKMLDNADAINIDIFKDFDYAALGHIHLPMKVAENAYYCGSPVPCDVSESAGLRDMGSTSVLLIDFKEKNNISVLPLPIKLSRDMYKLSGKLDDILSHACDDYVSVNITDDIDIKTARDKLKLAFPNLLNVTKTSTAHNSYKASKVRQKHMSLYEAALSFVPDLNKKDIKVLSDIINTIEGGADVS